MVYKSYCNMILLLLLSVGVFCLMGHATHADNQKIISYAKMETAIQNEKYELFLKNKKHFTNHPLYPYLYYKYLSNNLHKTSSTEIKKYLDDFDETSYEIPLRHKWLRHLAEQKKWKEYNEFYQPTIDTSLVCFHLLALYHRGQGKLAMQNVARYWLSSHSQPKECNELFMLWKQKGYLTEELIWKRFQLALNKKQYRLSRHLLKMLPQDKQPIATLWLRIAIKPTMITKTTFIKSALARRIIVFGIVKLADKRPFTAIRTWNTLKDTQAFTENDKRKVHKKIALELALKGKRNSITWFNKIPYNTKDKTLNEWRIRTFLLHKKWNKVHEYILKLNEDNQNKPCWQYWNARALLKLGKHKKAHNIFYKLARERHYYGFLSSHHLKKKAQVNHQALSTSKFHLNKISKHPHIQLSKRLYDDKDYTSARRNFRAATKTFDDHEKYLAAKVAASWGWHGEAIVTARHINHKDDLILRFPTAHKQYILRIGKTKKIHPAFIYALIRQESSFVHDAVSPDGALGLMQLLPGTVRDYARHLKRKSNYKKELLDINQNIKLGALHIKRMLRKFNGHYVLVAASYNAGQRQVKRWLSRRRPTDMTIWIETLPWYETRRYIKNILTYFVIYQHHLGYTPSIGEIMRL